MEAPQILPLEGIAGEAVGGKAAGLAALIGMGLPVPRGFVVLAAAKERFPPDLSRHYEALGGGRVAVRSSAIGEDGEDASFAGQYETLLGVEGLGALQAAILRCVASAESHHATAYAQDRAAAEGDRPSMCVVVQRMVEARAAGVLFTADPVSGRRDRLVIDAVEGLGEALVSGEKTPDHVQLDLEYRVVTRELAGEAPVLSDAELAELARAARGAAEKVGAPLDMEWAIDGEGRVHWLQARPITTLPADLCELDTPIASGDVLTTGNISEMMPGAVCPLTFSVTFRGIEHAFQHQQRELGSRAEFSDRYANIAMFYGHLFINLTGNLAASPYVMGMSAESLGHNYCGQLVPELKAPPRRNLLRRLWGGVQFFHYLRCADAVIEEFAPRLAQFRIEEKSESRAMMAQIDAMFHWNLEVEEVHVRSSSTSGVTGVILQNLVSGGEEPTQEELGEIANLLAGAEDVESALLVREFDAVVDAISAQPDAETSFRRVEPPAALAWLQSVTAGEAKDRFAGFLDRHGHRAYRETCVREKDWAADPLPLIRTMQTILASREAPGKGRSMQAPEVDLRRYGWVLRWLLPIAHNAIRRRERTKSMVARVTNHFGRAYRHLGKLLVEEGHFPDEDLVFFFTHAELGRFVASLDPARVAHAQRRREALAYQDRLEMPEISVGPPEPVEAPKCAAGDGVLAGRPVSRGVVEAPCRVAHTPEEAAALRPGEILVAPITDVAWTPYFSLISGLATDVGSSVSHGAVIAREYGLPAVVNLRSATHTFETGEILRLDGDQGTLRRIG